MALAEDVIGIFDELRSTDGSLRRARIVGRLWGAVRKLPSEERRELASILAERYAPALTERLARGSDLESGEMLSLVRTLGKVDAAEITDIMDQIQHPDRRRELLGQVAQSLQDDIAAADVDAVLDSPDMRLAVIEDAARELVDDLGIADAEASPPLDEPAGAPPAEAEPVAVVAPEPGELLPPAGLSVAAATHAGPAPPVDDADDHDVEEALERAVDERGAATEEDTLPLPTAVAPEGPPPGLPEELDVPIVAELTVDVAEPSLPDDGAGTPGAARHDMGVRMDIVDLAARVKAVPSPLVALKTVRSGTLDLNGEEAALVALALEDGWKRRRAVIALLARLESGDITGGARLILTLARTSDRRWAFRTAVEEWDLEPAQAAALADSVDVPATALRLAQTR